jgi:hypothetical protein
MTPTRSRGQRRSITDAPAVVRCDVKATWLLVDAAPLQAGLADRRRVHDRQQRLEVVDQHTEEQRLVLVLQRGEMDVLVHGGGPGLQHRHHSAHLVLDGFDAGRQQAGEVQPLALFRGECRAFVSQRVAQQVDAVHRMGWALDAPKETTAR